MQQVSLRDYCEDARLFIQSGEPHKAIHITRHILRHYPRHVESYRLLGQALLAAELYQEAAKQFRRVLSADPEDVSSHLGLSQIYQATGDLDKAVRYMQRAADISPGDADLRVRLGQLNQASQGDGRPEAPGMTRAALGRIHVRAGLHAKGVEEFESVLESSPDRGDVQTALAETLWRDGDHVGAAEVCQRILQKLPNALKANLIVGALWLENQEPEEAQSYLGLAQELDPENVVAQSLFGEASPLPPLEVKIEPLGEHELQDVLFGPPPTSPEPDMPVSEEQDLAIDWMGDSHEEESKPMSDEERADEEFELPDWLKGVGDDLLGESEGQPAASSPPESGSVEGEEEGEGTPDWLRDLVARVEESDASEESVPSEPGDVPDWLQELRPEVPEEIPSEAETPDWLEPTAARQPPDDVLPTEPELPEVEPVATEFTLEPMPGEAEDEGILTGEREETEPAAEESSVEELEAPVTPVAEAEVGEPGPPDWLTEIREGEIQPQPDAEPAVEEVEPSLLEPLSDVVDEKDVPDWLREITTAEAIPSEEAEPVTELPQPTPEVEAETAGLPDWLRESEEPAAAEEEEAEPELVAPDVAGEPSATADEGRAMWEQILAEEGVDLGSIAEAPPPDASGMTAEEWLRSTSDLEEAEPAAEGPTVEELEEPVTPVAEEIEGPAEEEPYPAAEVTPQPYRADLPDWLQQVAAGKPLSDEEAGPVVEAEPVEEAPDRMPELQVPEAEIEEPTEVVVEEPGEAVPGEEVEEVVEVEVDEAGLPDWLREPAAEAAEFEEPEAGPLAETPEWLAELETEDMLLAESEFEEPGELETGEMPEWLGEVMEGEPPLAEEWAAEPVEVEAQEEMPDWLREFRERERAAEPELVGEVEELEASAEAEEEAEVVEPSELPDWLLHLREGVSQAEAPPPVEEPAVAEIEVPSEIEAALPEEVAPSPVEEPIAAEEGLEELEVTGEEEFPTPEEAVEVPVAEIPSAEPAEPELEPVEAPAPELLVTRELEALQVEDLPKDPGARLSMARAAFETGDWSDALMIFETLVNSSEMLDSVIDNLEVGVRRHPDDPAGHQLLGDACMKDGRLHAALEAYRLALSKL